MKTINFSTVFSNDVELHHEVIRELYNIFGSDRQNNRDVIKGTLKFSFVLSGLLTTGIKHNNTVCGYEPTEQEQFELHLKKGDVIEWHEGCAEAFEHIRIER